MSKQIVAKKEVPAYAGKTIVNKKSIWEGGWASQALRGGD
jgi:hypothetical protein